MSSQEIEKIHVKAKKGLFDKAAYSLSHCTLCLPPKISRSLPNFHNSINAQQLIPAAVSPLKINLSLNCFEASAFCLLRSFNLDCFESLVFAPSRFSLDSVKYSLQDCTFSLTRKRRVTSSKSGVIISS